MINLAAILVLVTNMLHLAPAQGCNFCSQVIPSLRLGTAFPWHCGVSNLSHWPLPPLGEWVKIMADAVKEHCLISQCVCCVYIYFYYKVLVCMCGRVKCAFSLFSCFGLFLCLFLLSCKYKYPQRSVEGFESPWTCLPSDMSAGN